MTAPGEPATPAGDTQPVPPPTGRRRSAGRDLPAAIAMNVATVVYVVVNLLVDILYTYLDPRLRPS